MKNNLKKLEKKTKNVILTKTSRLRVNNIKECLP